MPTPVAESATSTAAAAQTRACRELTAALNEYITDTRILFIVQGRQFFIGASKWPVEVAIYVNRPCFFERVMTYGNLGLAEAYMDHDFEIADGTLAKFLHVLMRNCVDTKFRKTPQLVMHALLTRARDLLKGNNRNVRSHMDLPLELFQLTLDPWMAYTCGYAQQPEDTAEMLQRNKLDRICRKLRLQPGDTLADLGFGFGALMIYAAENYGVKCRGVNVSRVQFDYVSNKIQQRGLTDRIELVFGDYKTLDGQYDKVACIGMLEHLPSIEYRRFFRTLSRRLKHGGFALIQTIGCNAAKNEHDPFGQKYLFPGSGQARLSDIARGCETNGLLTLDVENKGRHYYYTAQSWLKNFLSNRERLASLLDEPFLRMWEYYLSGVMAMALSSNSALWQVLMTNDRSADLPLHRV